MKMMSKKYALYVLFAYIVFQFLWWEILMVKLNHQVFEKEKQLNALRISDKRTFEFIEKDLRQSELLKMIMVVSEGSVFLILILIGFYKVLKAYEREMIINERQAHFLLSLPHELKTPLSIIRLNLQTILYGKNIDEQKRIDVLQKSLYELNRLQNLIEDLLLSNKISKGKPDLKIETFNLSFVLNHLLSDYQKQRFIEYSIQDNVYINGDKILIELMLRNLLSNAIKFSQNIIQVLLYKKSESVCLEILNDGDLIADNEKEKIFEMFYRKRSDEEKGIKGTGIGLYIVKQIADAHKIKIHVLSKNNCNVFQVLF